ncbi:MAG: fumarylacetoacetate hydrolase family protein [Thaumarchaeota archaeon]|nr:fumarylacetoacetate hydrolase family protein [Nitrososphaerota archaeon]
MRLCTFTLRGEDERRQRVGAVVGQMVFELEAGGSMHELLASGRSLAGLKTKGGGYEVSRVRLYAPVPRPGKIFATIVNTQAMLGGEDVRLDRPRLDMKVPSTVIGPGETVLAPPSGVRPEVELAAIVGRMLAGASESEAAKGIAGYTVLNDVTAPADSREDAYEAYRRDRTTGVIRKSVMRGPLFRSKNHDTFCPMGPWIVTADELDVSDLEMSTWFGGFKVQEGSTSEYLFGPAKIASYLSGFLTLEPGDVISCGSVGWTKEALGDLDPTEFVLPKKEGALELEVEGIGKLLNPVSTLKQGAGAQPKTKT